MQNVTSNHTVIKKLVDSWHKRAGVRSVDYYQFNRAIAYDSNLPDYPIEMLPFCNHPRFAEASPKQQHDILTWAWLVYNERVITAEERVANPAFEMIMQGVFPGVDHHDSQQALQQCLIDEHFHTLIHRSAVYETRQRRGFHTKLHAPASIIYRTLLERQAEVSETWQKNLLTLVWTIVSEVSINAY